MTLFWPRKENNVNGWLSLKSNNENGSINYLLTVIKSFSNLIQLTKKKQKYTEKGFNYLNKH